MTGRAGADSETGVLETGIAGLVANRSVVVCCGPGGVGKTTVAGAVAMAAARRGRKAVVVTVDPARRLADALGVRLDTMVGTVGAPGRAVAGAHRVDGPWPGELWATMLDARATFDDLVRRYAPSPERAEAILANRLYRNLAGSLSGTQEYMAAERLFELHEDDRYDIVVVDTPPTRNALDFLDAPRRLGRFLDSRAYRLLMVPARSSLRAVGVGAGVLVRNVSKVVGSDVVSDATTFFQAFEGMEGGFRERSEQVAGLLAAPTTAYLVVTSLRPETLADATYLAERLRSLGNRLDGVIANRAHPSFGTWEPAACRLRAQELVGTALEGLAANLAEMQALAAAEAELLASLADSVGAGFTVRVPELESDVHDLHGIALVADHLVEQAPGRVAGER